MCKFLTQVQHFFNIDIDVYVRESRSLVYTYGLILI